MWSIQQIDELAQRKSFLEKIKVRKNHYLAERSLVTSLVTLWEELLAIFHIYLAHPLFYKELPHSLWNTKIVRLLLFYVILSIHNLFRIYSLVIFPNPNRVAWFKNIYMNLHHNLFIDVGRISPYNQAYY